MTQGNVIAWESEFFIPEAPTALHVPLIAADLPACPPMTDIGPAIYSSNSAFPTLSRTSRPSCISWPKTPFRRSWIRSPGRMQNTFANECFIDELAALVGADPLDFRLKYLDRIRAAPSFWRLATLATGRNGPRRGRTAADDVVAGRGISYMKYELVAHLCRCGRRSRGRPEERGDPREAIFTSRKIAGRSSTRTAS